MQTLDCVSGCVTGSNSSNTPVLRQQEKKSTQVQEATPEKSTFFRFHVYKR